MGKLFVSKVMVFVLFLVFGLFFLHGITMAAPFYFGDGGSSLQSILDGITVAPIPGDSGVNVLTDAITDDQDSYWSITASGGSVSTMIIEIAGYANSNCFGVYDAGNAANKVQLFDGPDSTGAQVTLSITSLGSVYLNHLDTGIDFSGDAFGFYLTIPTGYTWYSDTSLNIDKADHMVAYQGKNADIVQILPWSPGLWTDNEYILAFEDLAGGGDRDYNDMVVMIESVTPSPEPATLLFLGFGILSLGLVGKKRS